MNSPLIAEKRRRRSWIGRNSQSGGSGQKLAWNPKLQLAKEHYGKLHPSGVGYTTRRYLGIERDGRLLFAWPFANVISSEILIGWLPT